MPELQQYQVTISSRDRGRNQYMRPEPLHKISTYNLCGAMAADLKCYNDQDDDRKPAVTYGKEPEAFGGRVATRVVKGVCDAMLPQTPTKRPRAKESSRHFGVRYRPDLSKYVAEIRVAEWKSVDKKVWLGTFDSEEGAARAVDSARKILRCGKKRLFNFPCPELENYREAIPQYLDLTDLTNEVMYKDVTNYIKRKAQDYASMFCPNMAGMSKQLSTSPSASSKLGHAELPAVEDHGTPKGDSPTTSCIAQYAKLGMDEYPQSCPTSIPLSSTASRLHYDCHQDSTLIRDEDDLLFGAPDLCGSETLTIEDSEYCRQDAAGDAHGHFGLFQRQQYYIHDDQVVSPTCSNSAWPGAAAGYGHQSSSIDIHSRTSTVSTHVEIYDAPMQLDVVDPSVEWVSYLNTISTADPIATEFGNGGSAAYNSWYTDDGGMSEILGRFDSSGNSCSYGPNESIDNENNDAAFIQNHDHLSMEWIHPSADSSSGFSMASSAPVGQSHRMYNAQDHLAFSSLPPNLFNTYLQ